MADNQQYGPLAPKQTSASEIRKVIANGPKAIGQGSTIATADELKKKEVDKANSNPKVPTTTKKQTTTTKTNTNVVAPKQTNTVVKKPEAQGVNKFASLMQGQISGDLFKNPAAQPINDIKVVKQDNEATHNAAQNNNNDISFMNNFGRAKELKDTVDVDNALMDLYSDIKVKVDNGTLASSDVAKMKQAYPEFANMGDDVLLSMIGDMASIANKKMPFNDVNMKKLKSLYPELNSAAWGFDKGNSENMYQAGGMREQMAQSSKTDLNRFGTAGAVAEAAINPIGEATTLLDMGAQMIPQVDSNNDRSSALQKELQKIVSNENLLNQYKEQYKKFVKENGTLSSLYTTQLEGDNTVERLWNWVRGKSKQDLDAGFRDWLVHTVNNKVNGWTGELMGDANELVGVTGPNVAKMYANMPASAVKTVTAITRAITNPIDTAAGLYHLFGTEEGRQALISRYGSWDGFAKALEQDPVGVASDGLAVVEGGAGLTKMATGGLSKASLLAGLSTEALGVARTTENLLKLATRLENMAIKAGKIEKTAGLASNLGADLPINKVINGLRKWGESGESMIQKVAKYSVNASQTGIGTVAGKVIDEGKQIIKDGPINTIANKLMGSATDSDKLFKAASPNINKLANNVDYKNKRKNMDIATQAIVDAGFTPKTVSEWAKAHTDTLNKKWNEFKQMVKDKADFEVDVKDLLTEVKDYIKREREGATEAQKTDLRKLEVEVNNIERRGKVDMGFIENRKEHYNSSWRDADKLKVGDIYLKGIKLIGNAMRKQQDNILGKGPEQTKKLRKEIAALMDTKEDVIKADVRNQKKKSDIAGGGLVESYGRLSGLGDVIGGVVGGVFGKGGEGFAQAGKGLGKMVLGKAMGKARDVDYLTKKGFEGLSKKKGLGAQKEGGLRSKFQDSRELGDLLVERDKLKKELKDEKLSKEEKEKKQKRYDDVEYAIAQKRARSGLGDKENKLTAESKKKVIDMVQKRAKDVGYVTEVVDGMEKDTQGYTDLRKKLIALEKNPGDTTAQHELFHAFFSVVDNKTKTYILDEAKKILKDSGMKDVSAEEWLAESFGIYAKRQQIKLGLIDAPKGFVAKVRDFFQRVYEYMQRFNGDRATINKLFDEVLGDRQMKNGIIDLSDLLGDKEVKVREMGDNGLRNKAVYHGSPADFDKFDSSHMGEGEGNQAHGWGHYVAVDKKTAEKYAEMGKFKNNSWEYDGQKADWLLDNNKPDWERGEEIARNSVLSELNRQTIKNKSYTPEQAIKDLRKEWTDIIEKDKEAVKDTVKSGGNPIFFNNRIYKYEKWLEGLDKLEAGKFKDNGQGRNLYNLDIPDPKKADTPTGSNYLEEKKELTSKQVGEFFDKLKEKYPEIVDKSSKGGFGRDRMSIEYHWYEKGMPQKITAERLYEQISTILGSDKATSKFLESLGYDGIHYFGGRDGEAYVIFNDDALQIKDHIRYKKKVGDKDVEITPEADSPDQLIEKNADGLSVMKSFISEKQAEKALNVNKALLDKDGNPYLWTHTNKYDAPQFANFENTKDSKYKEFGDYEIAWFSNSEDMSRSYANQESKLADTKPINSIEEFNDRFSKYDVDGEPYDTEWHKGGDGKEWKYSHRTSIDKEGAEYVLNQYDSESHKYKNLEKLYDEWHNGGYDGQSEKEVIDGIKKLVHEEFIDSPDFRLYDDVDIKKEKDGYVLTTSSKKELGRYKSEQEALAKSTAKKHVSGKYHYQGIITDIKNPLVVDLGKYKPGEIKRFGDGAKMMGEHGRYWSDLGNAYEFVKKEQPNVDEIFSKVEKEWGGAKKASNDIKYYAFDIEREGDNLYKAYKEMEEGPAKKFAEERLLNYRKASDVVGYISRGVVDELKPEWRNLRVESNGKTTTIGNLYDKAISEYNKYKDVFDVFGEGNRIWKESGKYSQPEGYDKSKTKNFINLLKKNGMSEGAISILHGTDLMNRIDLVYSPFASEGWAITKLRDKSLQTNDYVFYALRKGGYDGVLFKDIVDYGGKGDNKGGDVLAAFKSKDFKAWDNANPTDSKYISYKKKVSLDKKAEGLSKKDSSGLLAKGRERTLGIDGLRYKTNISEKDSSGKKLSEGQKKFFAGSKVVDKDGNLLRVYHGTVAGDFTVFQKYGNRTSNNIASDVGFWFTPNKKGAINFAKESSWRGDNKARAEEVYLDIKNPKVYEPSEFNLKDYEERDKLIDSKYKEVYAARNEMNKYDYNHFWMGEYTHENHVNRGIFNKLEYIYNQKGKITEADLKDIKEEYGKINWDGYYKPGIDATYEDFKNYLQAKKKYEKLNDEYLKMKHSDSYDDFKADIYKLDNKKRDKLDFALDDMDAAKKYIDNLKKEGYDGIIIKGTEYDGTTLGEGARNDQYVAFNSNQIKRITNENPTKNEDIRFKKVYHGSPADFDAFDSSHMGEGEGAQAHGWGHYVAVDENTAKRYANMRGNGEASYKGKTRQSIKDMAGLQTQEENMALGIMARMEEWGKTFEDARDSMIKDNEGYIKKLEQQIDKKDISWYGSLDYMKEKLKEAKDEIEILNRLDKKDFSKTKRNLYTLDIPDPVKKDTPTGSNYLEEKGELNNKELEKFSRKLENELGFEIRSLDYATMDDVKKMGEKLGWGDDFVNEVKEDLDAWKDGDIAGAIVKELKYGVSDFDKFLKDNGFFYLNDRNIYNGGKLYEHISKLLGSDKKASKFLESLGYDGIHYFGGRDGEAYVIFNDDSLEIKDHIRYKKGLTAKDQTQTPEFKKWFEGSKVVDKSGKPLEVYHGSRHAGFTEFKPVNSFEDGLYFFSNKRHIASYFGGGDTLWSDKGLQGKFDEAKAKGIDEVKKFAKRYFNTPQEIEVSMNHITPKEAKEFGVEPGYFYHIDDGQVSSPIRINGKRTFDKPLSQKEIDDAILREVQSSVDYYGAEDKKKSQVYASYLDIKNPLEVEAKGNKFSHVLNPIDGQYHHVADIAYMAKENGYDGVIIKDVSESPEKDLRGDDYIVWDSRQIKSATDNIGTFDKNNPDIRYKKGLKKKGKGLEKKSNASILAKGRDRK